MDHIKDQAVDEVLTEASDFTQWAARIDELWRNVGLDLYTSSNARYPRGRIREPHRRSSKKCRRARVLLIILTGVCHGIRMLIPEAAKRDPFQIWAAIEVRVKPFRFTDLSGELRNKIYHHLLPRKAVIVAPQRSSERRPIPPLLHVSHQIRNESASIYYGEICPTFVVNLESTSDQALKVRERDVECFNHWLGIVGPFQKYLRHILINTINLDVRYRQRTICLLRYKENIGLGVFCPWELTSGKETELKAYIHEVNQRGKLRGWKGERIIDALMTQPEMWTLKYDDIARLRPQCAKHPRLLAILSDA